MAHKVMMKCYDGTHKLVADRWEDNVHIITWSVEHNVIDAEKTINDLRAGKSPYIIGLWIEETD